MATVTLTTSDTIEVEGTSGNLYHITIVVDGTTLTKENASEALADLAKRAQDKLGKSNFVIKVQYTAGLC